MTETPQDLIHHLPLESIVASLTNPRTTFNAEALASMGKTIKASGVHTPILVRPLPGSRVPDTTPGVTHEIIAGERRYRASRLVGMTTIPALVKDLTDAEVYKIQLIENVQREDLSPLEKAEGYSQLLRNTGMSRAELAEEVGQSLSTIHAALKLLDLGAEGRKALNEGKIDASHALLIARIPSTELQAKALKAITRGDYYGQTMSYRAAAEYVQSEFMLNLNKAKFSRSDAELLPEAGACRSCSKRSGANPDIFTDVKGADVCIDTACYRKKEAAHSDALLKAARESGATLIEGKEAKALMPSAYNSRVEGHYRLDDAADSPTDKPLRKLLSKEMEKAGVTPVLVVNPHKDGEIIATLPIEQVTQLLRAAGQNKVAEDAERESQNEAAYKAERQEAEAKNKLEAKWRWQVLEAIWPLAHAQYCAPLAEDVNDILRFAAARFANTLNADKCKALCKLLLLGKVAPKEGVMQWIADTEEPLAALALLVAHSQVEYQYWGRGEDANKALFTIAAGLGIDHKDIERKARSDARADAMKAKATEKKAKKAAEAPEGDLPLAPAARRKPKGGGKTQTDRPAARAKTSRAPAKPKLSEEEARLGIANAMQNDEAPAMLRSPASEAVETPAPEEPTGQQEGGIQVGDRVTVIQAKHPWLDSDGTVTSLSADGKVAKVLLDGHTSEESIRVVHTMVIQKANWPFPTAPASATAATPAVHQVGTRVRVNNTATNTSEKKFIGRKGEIVAQIGPECWDVNLTMGRKGSGLYERKSFMASELEVLA